ncbi:MAG: hypothetical protein EOP04_12695 [Proteobacteria bacterium]|nr:MAG: hypothetical protein EOP04_12695 [Pseudomonadota bacterium]
MKLVRSTPELSSYFRITLARYEGLLAKEIQKESEVSKLEAECISKLVLEGVNFAWHSTAREEALNLVFKVLKKGWKL